jgi:hypothetical protein
MHFGMAIEVDAMSITQWPLEKLISIQKKIIWFILSHVLDP